MWPYVRNNKFVLLFLIRSRSNSTVQGGIIFQPPTQPPPKTPHLSPQSGPCSGPQSGPNIGPPLGPPIGISTPTGSNIGPYSGPSGLSGVSGPSGVSGVSSGMSSDSLSVVPGAALEVIRLQSKLPRQHSLVQGTFSTGGNNLSSASFFLLF